MHEQWLSNWMGGDSPVLTIASSQAHTAHTHSCTQVGIIRRSRTKFRVDYCDSWFGSCKISTYAIWSVRWLYKRTLKISSSVLEKPLHFFTPNLWEPRCRTHIDENAHSKSCCPNGYLGYTYSMFPSPVFVPPLLNFFNTVFCAVIIISGYVVLPLIWGILAIIWIGRQLIEADIRS